MDQPRIVPNAAVSSAPGELDVRRRIKYEEELDHAFPNRIAELAHGEKFYSCIQCGTCSGTCPVSHYMDYTPRRIIAMVREGFRAEVLNSQTVWLCASCYACTCDCPRGIKITDVMYAIKREAIEQGVYPKRFPTPVLANAFFNQVMKDGRSSEGKLMMKVFLGTNPFKAFGNMLLGMKLFFTGRISMKSERIKDRKSLKALLAALDRLKEAK